MSIYDGKELLTFQGAVREYDVPMPTLEMAAAQGSLKVIEQDGQRWLPRYAVEQLVKRTVKRGAGNVVISAWRPLEPTATPSATVAAQEP